MTDVGKELGLSTPSAYILLHFKNFHFQLFQEAFEARCTESYARDMILGA